MAVIDQDNFSNISWHSEQNPDAAGPSTSTSHEPPDYSGGSRPDSKRPSRSDDHHGHAGGEILECIVSDPHKENDGTKDAYVSYLITTHTTFSTFQRPTTSVRRRFTDFVFLYKVLIRDYQGCAVPPLPDKQRMEYVRGDRFGTDFTSRRAYSLQRFLSRLALHPMLRRASILHTFLESPDWNATMRSRAARASLGGAGGDGLGQGSPSGGGGGVFDTLADSFMNAFTKVHKPDRRFIEVKEKSDKLDEDLNHVEKVVARVARREGDLETDLRELAEQFQKLITLEPGVESAVRAFAASVEDTAAGLKKLKDHTDQDYLGSLRDMVAYSAALKNLLKAREQKQLDYEQLTEYLNKSTTERDAMLGVPAGAGAASSPSSILSASSPTAAAAAGGGGGGSTIAGTASHYSGAASALVGGAGGFLRAKLEDVRGVDHEQARRDRQRKLELRIDELTREVEAARAEADRFADQVVREVESFEWIKRVELKRQFAGLVDAHVGFYDGVIETWERYVREMESEGVVLPPEA